MDAGTKLAEAYANAHSLRDYVRRSPDSFDPRTTFQTPRKNQGNTTLCGKLISTKTPHDTQTTLSFVHHHNHGWGSVPLIPRFQFLINFCYLRHLLWQSLVRRQSWSSPHFGWPCARRNKDLCMKVDLKLPQHICLLTIIDHHPDNQFRYVGVISFLSAHAYTKTSDI